jgi:hypothetical protein
MTDGDKSANPKELLIAIKIVTHMLKSFHENKGNPYWSEVHEIMDDCWRLQDRINQYLRDETHDSK